MTSQLKKWTSPTGQTRVYVNDSRLCRGTKLFFFESGKNWADFRVQAESAQAHSMAKKLACEIGDMVKGDWSKLLAMAS